MEKEKFMRGNRSRMIGWLSIVLLAGGSFLLFSPRIQGLSLAAQGTELSYQVKDFQNGKAQFYQYKTNDGITIKYFILKSSDGVIRAAFDACDVCFPFKKGYRQQSVGVVQCNNCGRVFDAASIDVQRGGCNPGPIAAQVVGANLVIPAAQIQAGVRFF